jgi:hypothetical protein
MLYDVFSDLFPSSFQSHVSRLQADTQYRSEFQATVANMPLDMWYKTPKWKCTAKFLKLIHPRCETCECPHSLQVHHKTYKHLGAEILYPGDLQVLCDSCHAALHQLAVWPRSRVQTAFHFPMQ